MTVPLWRAGLAACAALAIGCGAAPAGSNPNPNTNPNQTANPNAGKGVVGDGVCFPLCANGDTDPDGDGWGFENQASCVVAASLQAKTRIPCMIGAPVPTTVGPPPDSPGVVVDTATGRSCVGLCSPVVPDDGTGWGYELGASCVIAGSATAMSSLTCRIGQPLTGLDLTGLPGRLVNEVCTAFCRAALSDPDGDGWGYELGLPCLVNGSTTATSMGIDCKVGENVLVPPAVLNQTPPPGTVQKPGTIASSGFFVSGGRLYDRFGNAFVIRGVNNLHIYFDSSNQYLAYQALDEIAALGVNTIRIVWLTTGSATNLARVIRRVVELRMVPMIELQDVTGGTTNEGLLSMAAYYARDDVKAVLLAYQDFLLVNIANEWSGTDFRNAYLSAISLLRTAGLNHTLVIDANRFGQNAAAILADGGPLLAADPQHNLLFSIHMYQEFAATVAGRANITTSLAQVMSSALPLVIGEFGWQAGGTLVDSALIMSECARLGIGYIAWSWKGNNASLAYLDMAADWQGQTLTTWGNDVIHGPNGIAQTARRASLFAP